MVAVRRGHSSRTTLLGNLDSNPFLVMNKAALSEYSPANHQLGTSTSLEKTLDHLYKSHYFSFLLPKLQSNSFL